MADRIELARLKITPVWGILPLPAYKLTLVQQGTDFRVEACEQTGRLRKLWRVSVPPDEVTQHLNALRKATLPAFPVSPLVCDGEHVELTIRGEGSDLTLGWCTASPFGADALAGFADWLRKLVASHAETR